MNTEQTPSNTRPSPGKNGITTAGSYSGSGNAGTAGEC